METSLEHYLEFCRPYRLPEPWQCCESDPNAFVGPEDPAAAFALLQANHQPDKLVAGGIARLGATGQLELNPLLAESNVRLIVLDDTMSAGIRNLITERGCVIGELAPMFEVLGDRNTGGMFLAAERAVFATDTIDDAILLRSFGLAAAPVVGLDRLNQQAIELLCQYYGMEQTDSVREREQQELAGMDEGDHGFESSPDPDDRSQFNFGNAPPTAPTMPPYLVPSNGQMGRYGRSGVRLALVRWNVRAVSKTDAPSMQRTVDEFMVLKKCRRLELNETSNWIPSDHDLETLRFALDRREPKWIKAALLDSAYDSVGEIECPGRKTHATPPTSLAAAVDYLHGVILKTADEKNRKQVKEALNNYHRVIGEKVTLPLLRQAESVVEPLERAMQFQFAQLNALFLDKAPRVREQALLGLVQRNPDTGKTEDNGVSELLSISAQLVALAKELKWKSRRTVNVSCAPTSKLLPARRFGTSDLAARN